MVGVGEVAAEFGEQSSGVGAVGAFSRIISREHFSSWSDLPERGRQTDIAEHLLRLLGRSPGECRLEPIAVPALRQWPHLSECRRGSSGGLVVLRPKEPDVASSEHDVVPPSVRGQWECDVSVVLVQLVVADGELE